MRSRDYAEVLMRKAAQDEFVARALVAIPDSPDEAIGFHAQQAVEKMLKAVLVSRQIRYRWRHDLVELIDLLREGGIPLPTELEDVRRLNPFAAELRYGELPVEDEEPLDRTWALGCVQRVRQWAESVLQEAEGADGTDEAAPGA